MIWCSNYRKWSYRESEVCWNCIYILHLECRGNYFFDLAPTNFKISLRNPPTGATVVPGYNRKGKALVFGSNADPVYMSGRVPQQIISTLTLSDDLTYYTEFKLPRKLNKSERWVFFSVQNKDFEKVYFEVGLKSIEESDGQNPEGEKDDSQG